MKLINPKEISGAIMNLIDEADESLIIISPYYNMAKWEKLLQSFKMLRKKNVAVEFYVRGNEQKNFEEVNAIGYTPKSIPNLHTKLYINEKYAIVTSMNLTESSDKRSIDIGYKTETEDERKELITYYERYIKSNADDDSNEKINHPNQDNNTTKEIPVETIDLSFADFRVPEYQTDWSNWKEKTVNYIKDISKYKYANYYMKDAVVHFKTNVLNFGCYFHYNYGKSYFTAKIDCPHDLFNEFNELLDSLKIETGAKIDISGYKNAGIDIFIYYNESVKSELFEFINNDDIPVLLKTLNSTLYIMSILKGLIKNKLRKTLI